MNPSSDCERARLQLMAALDGEAGAPDAAPQTDARRHLGSCSACDEWLRNLEALSRRAESAPYLGAEPDLWPALEGRIKGSAPTLSASRLVAIGAFVLGWRALQLLLELPLPMLHPVVPLLVVAVALWRIGGDPLAIQTFAPELQKRGA